MNSKLAQFDQLGNPQSRQPARVSEDSLEVAVKAQERVVLLPNLASSTEARFLELLRQGDSLVQQEVAAAIEAYRQALQLKPDSAEAYQHLAQALSQQGNLEEAAVCYRKAIELTANALPEAGSVLSEVSKQGQIKKSYIRVSKIRKKSAEADENRETEKEPESDIEKLPWFEEAAFYLQQGKVQCSLKNWQGAITACQRAMQLMGPRAAEAYHILGQAFQGLGNLDEARQSYSKALMLQPEAADVHAYLGSVYAAQQQWTEAMNCYQQAITLNPNFAEAYWQLGELWQKQGNRAQATRYWYQALQLKPDWATAHEYWRLATALTEQGKLEEAVSAYAQAIQADPTFAEAYHNLGIVLGKQGKWQDALTYHRQAVERNPRTAQLWAGLGRALIALENWEEAISTYQEVIKLTVDGETKGYPVFQHALAQLEQCQKAMVAKSYYNMAEGLSQRGKLQDAITCYRQAIERYPNSAQFYAGLGKALASADQWQEAIAAYQRAMELAPQNTQYYLAFGEVLIRREQLQKQRRLQPEQNDLHLKLRQNSKQVQASERDATLHSNETAAFTLV